MVLWGLCNQMFSKATRNSTSQRQNNLDEKNHLPFTHDCCFFCCAPYSYVLQYGLPVYEVQSLFLISWLFLNGGGRCTWCSFQVREKRLPFSLSALEAQTCGSACRRLPLFTLFSHILLPSPMQGSE